MAGESLLVNFVYCHAVGHAVEALQHCLGYRRADADRRIGLVLKANPAVELADWCAFSDEVYTVDVDVFTVPAAEVLEHVPGSGTGLLTIPGAINPAACQTAFDSSKRSPTSKPRSLHANDTLANPGVALRDSASHMRTFTTSTSSSAHGPLTPRGPGSNG